MPASSLPDESAVIPMNVWSLSRKAGRDLLLERAWQQLWLDKLFFGLRCDLEKLPIIPKARMPVKMEPLDLKNYRGFEAEYALVSGHDALEVYARERLREAGVSGAHQTMGPNGEPAFVHWLIMAKTQDELHSFQPGRYRKLGADEALIEGAYTFTAFRGKGLMMEGMAQLLMKAREAGVKRVWTYVALENIPSLRGCARVGFVPDHLRHNRRRLGAMHTDFLPLTLEAMAQWDQSVPVAA